MHTSIHTNRRLEIANKMAAAEAATKKEQTLRLKLAAAQVAAAAGDHEAAKAADLIRRALRFI